MVRSLAKISGVCLILFFIVNTVITSRNMKPLMDSIGMDQLITIASNGYPAAIHRLTMASSQASSDGYEEYIPGKIPRDAVDITFVHSDPNEGANPNMGARDQDGNEGYVPDVTMLRKNPPKFSLQGTELTEACLFKDHWGDWEAMENRIRLVNPKLQHSQPRSKLLCIVYSVDPYQNERIPVILETWGSKCDGFFVGSNKTDPSLHTVDVPHQGPEFYGNMWQKVRSLWGFVYDNFYDDYDWFHMGGDDMWVLVENLRYYLDSPEVREAAYGGHSKMQVPLYLGTTFAQEGNLNELFQTGGPGYTLNKAALKVLVLRALPFYHVSMWKSMEDLKIAQAFRRIGVPPFRTATKEGSVRYNHFPPGRHYRGREPHFYKNKYTSKLNYTRGAEHSAKYSVSFHYIDTDEMLRLHAHLYGMCRNDTAGPTIDHPQPPFLGRHASESAYPYLSIDVWHEIVDNNRSFFVRPEFKGELATEDGWINWLDDLPWPVKLVTNNNVDWAWPHDQISITPKVLEHPNLERLYAMNPNMYHPKLTPTPIGLKWQWRSTHLYGEPKRDILAMLHNVSTSGDETKQLFLKPRAPSVWIRPATNRRGQRYELTNAALRTHRSQVCPILNSTAPRYAVCPPTKVDAQEYWRQLKMHRFVASPAGKGLDTHATWEALLAGCVPIVPRSTLDPVFEGLPVWLVDSWEEVTDEAVLEKAKLMLLNADNFKWDKVFATGWKEELRS